MAQRNSQGDNNDKENEMIENESNNSTHRQSGEYNENEQVNNDGSGDSNRRLYPHQLRGKRRERLYSRFQGAKMNDDSSYPSGPRHFGDRFMERLQLISGPMYDLNPINTDEKKFAGRNRLYIGNLPANMTEDEFNEILKPYGDTSETFINKEKCFGFIRFDYYANAEKAKRDLDGSMQKGRIIKVRFAPKVAAIKVKNLTPWVTNELLHVAFSVFGDIESCVVIVDERGKTTGEGIVEYVRKPSALSALKHCGEGCFFITSSLRPVIVETCDQVNMTEGFPEKSVTKNNQEYQQAREIGPRFAKPGSFEYEYGTRWKHLHEIYKQKEFALKQELALEEKKLEAQMQYAKFENETEILREQLRIREKDRDRQKQKWEEHNRRVEEFRERHLENMQNKINCQEDHVCLSQQDSLFVKARQLTNILNEEEQQSQSYNYNDEEEKTTLDPKSFMNSYERNNSNEGQSMDTNENMYSMDSGQSNWINNYNDRGGGYRGTKRQYSS